MDMHGGHVGHVSKLYEQTFLPLAQGDLYLPSGFSVDV